MAKICLQKILKEKKISKTKFAKLMGTPYGNIMRYFEPDCDPKFSTLEKWAKKLDVSIKDLVED